MAGIENRILSSQPFNENLNANLSFYNGEKYSKPVGLRDIDFYIDQELIKLVGMGIPINTLGQAEKALTSHAIQPTKLIEIDSTEHTVLLFDPRPVGFSGFMNCVTHSIILTNHGLFEAGRYPAMNLNESNHLWNWFLHRRLATVEYVNEHLEDHDQSITEFMQDAYQALTQF